MIFLAELLIVVERIYSDSYKQVGEIESLDCMCVPLSRGV
jgi:hypothetical protein